VKFASVAEAVVEAVCFVYATVVLWVEMSSALQFQPVVAVGSPITPVLPLDVPTPTRNAAVPLLAVMEAPDPNPDETVGAVLEMRRFVVFKVGTDIDPANTWAVASMSTGSTLPTKLSAAVVPGVVSASPRPGEPVV
jgi:hypothetical protein